MKGRLLITVLFMIGFGSEETWSADWKYFGGSVLSKAEQVFVFFDNESIEYLPNGNVRVWTKTITPSEVGRIAEKKEVIEKAAQKVANGYSPPYVLSKPNPQPSFEIYMELLAWEEAG